MQLQQQLPLTNVVMLKYNMRLVTLCCNKGSKLVPLVNISSTLSQFVIFAGISVMIASRSIQNPQGNTTVLAIGVLLFCGNYTFAFITLPVEYDASKEL